MTRIRTPLMYALFAGALSGLLLLLRRKPRETAMDEVDEASLESFPASDPPQFGR